MSNVVKRDASIKSLENALDVLEVFGEIDGEIRNKLRGQVQNILVKGAYDKDQLFRKIGEIIGRPDRKFIH